ncbi:MAG TPA: winged helix-turn-helix domain-containing protein, partial [Anaerolineales bacterium]|nr:winged helix-turn-helix domain-containing protein [Anaerolineales bacterium]
ALDDIPPKAYDILYYLYERSGSVISKDELYYRAYLGLERLPRSSAERDYAAPKDYLGLIDTNLYRIRQAIEPDPSFPVLLQTVRGHGVRLVSRW